MHSSYTKQHLLNYVKFQLQNGYYIEDIAEVLLKYGYAKKIVDEIVYEIGDIEIKHDSKGQKVNLKTLRKELVEYTFNLILDYINQELEQGYTESSINRALLNQGHHKELIEEAFKQIKKGKPIVKRHAPAPIASIEVGHLFIIALILLLAASFLLSIGVDETIFVVAMTLAPAFIGISVTYFILTTIRTKYVVSSVPLIAVVIVVGVFAYLLNYSVVYSNKDPIILMVINVVLAIILSSFMMIFKRGQFEQPPQAKKIEDLEVITEEDIGKAKRFSESYDKKQAILAKTEVEGKEQRETLKEFDDKQFKDDLDKRGGVP